MKQLNSFIITSLFINFVSIFTSCDAVKETVNYGSANDHASVIFDLIKRLGEPSYKYELPDDQEEVRPDPPATGQQQQSESASHELQNMQSVCDHVVEKGNIINTKESISAGAVYIDSVKNVNSNADCMGFCCQNSTCDVAVYQDKGDRDCYLFRCAGLCIFKSHKGYFVSTIKGRKSAEHPEEDLQNLKDEVTGNGSGDKKTAQDAAQKLADNPEVLPPVAELATVKVVATTQTEPPELVIAPHSVGLGGFCTLNGQCEDPDAVCGHGNCVCKDAFYNKGGMCRKICLQSEFECFELGTLTRGPECISRSQVCDSYLNCADGSDEFNCENTAPNNQQTNWSQQSGPASSGIKGPPKSNNPTDQYTQPVVQEPAAESHQKNIIPPPSNPQASYQTHVAKEHGMGSHEKAGNMHTLQNYDVRLKPTIASKDGSMHLNQNLYSGNVQPHPPQTNQYPDTGYVGNLPDNSDFSSGHAANTNTNQARKDLVNHKPYNLPSVPKNSNPPNVQQAIAASKIGSKVNSDNPVKFSAPTQTGQRQRLDPSGSGQNIQKHINPQPVHQAGYTEAGQNDKYSSQFMGNHAMKNQQHPLMPQTNSLESGMRSSSILHPDASGNSFPQNSRHVDKSLPQKASSSLKSSKPVNAHSQSSGNASSKSRTKIQASSKSHTSPFDQSEPQNRLSMPSYSNPQKWLDPSLYVPYNLGESPSQQEQAPVGNHYFDSSQYYPPYSSDTLDPLPESLLENSASNDEFSQFGGPDVGHGKSLGLPYNTQNSGYQGYPESSYGGQYPPSIRYDDSGDYRSPVYQDPDLYSSLGTQRAYRPSAGLYEDFPSGMRPPQSSIVHKVQDSEEPPSADQKKIKEAAIVHGQSTQAPKTESHATRLPLEGASSKNKMDSAATSPLPATHKPYPESHSEKKHIFLSSEKVIIANTSDAEGPIIALSLGLAFTLILLVLVGCRLRNVRHRLRKGRPLHQNEADYLINGMYL